MMFPLGNYSSLRPVVAFYVIIFTSKQCCLPAYLTHYLYQDFEGEARKLTKAAPQPTPKEKVLMQKEKRFSNLLLTPLWISNFQAVSLGKTRKCNL